MPPYFFPSVLVYTPTPVSNTSANSTSSTNQSMIESWKKTDRNFHSTPKIEVLKSPFSGFYGGLMGGVVQANATFSTSTSALFETIIGPGNQEDLVQHNIHVYSNHPIGALYAGYGQFMNDSDFFLAAEIAGNLANRENALANFANNNMAHIESHALTVSTIVSLWQGEFDADLRPGYLLATNVLLAYGRLGLAVNQLNMTTTNNFQFTHIC